MIDIAKNIPDKVYVGIDVGSVSVKVAVIGGKNYRGLFQKMCANGKFFSKSDQENGNIPEAKQLVVSKYQRTLGEPVKVTYEILKECETEE